MTNKHGSHEMMLCTVNLSVMLISNSPSNEHMNKKQDVFN